MNDRLVSRVEVLAALRKHRIKRFTFTLLIGVSNSGFSSWLNWNKPLPAGQREEVTLGLAFLDELRREFKDISIPIDPSNIDAVRAKWKEFREKNGVAA